MNNEVKLTHGFTDEEWAAALAGFKSHRGDPEVGDDQLIMPGESDMTPNKVIAEIEARSAVGAAFVQVYFLMPLDER